MFYKYKELILFTKAINKIYSKFIQLYKYNKQYFYFIFS